MKNSFASNFTSGFIGATLVCAGLITLTHNVVPPTLVEASLSSCLGGFLYGLCNGVLHKLVTPPSFTSRAGAAMLAALAAIVWGVWAGTFAGFSVQSALVIALIILVTAGATTLFARLFQRRD